MIVAVYRHPSPKRPLPGVPETLLSGIQSGLRYARHSAPLRALVIRNLSFSFCASALWALLPLVARDLLVARRRRLRHADGVVRRRRDRRRARDPAAHEPPLAQQHRDLGRRAVGGRGDCSSPVDDARCWSRHRRLRRGRVRGSPCSSSLAAGTQSAAPAWVRARAVATNLVTNQASLALGSVLWGVVAIACRNAHRARRLGRGDGRAARAQSPGRVAMADEADVTPGAQLPDLAISVEPEPDDGPGADPDRLPDRRRASRGVPARRIYDDRTDPAAQRRGQLARLSRPRARTGVSSSAS